MAKTRRKFMVDFWFKQHSVVVNATSNAEALRKAKEKLKKKNIASLIETKDTSITDSL